MKKQYQIEQQRAVQQFRRIATEQNPNIQMILPLADIVGMLPQGVGNLLRETGLALMQTVMEEEVRQLAGARTAGGPKTAIAWWTARKCRSARRGSAQARPKTSANNGWAATSCSSAADRCSRACGTK